MIKEAPTQLHSPAAAATAAAVVVVVVVVVAAAAAAAAVGDVSPAVASSVVSPMRCAADYLGLVAASVSFAVESSELASAVG